MPIGFNIVDWLLLLIVLLAAIRGCLSGLRMLLPELIALIGGLYAALRLARMVAAELNDMLPLPGTVLAFLAYALTFVIVGAGLLLLGRTLFGSRTRVVYPSVPGLLAGLLAGLVVAALVAALLLTMPLPSLVVNAASESRYGPRLAAQALRFVTPGVPR